MTTEDNQDFVTRNEAIGFAQRTRKNLEHIRGHQNPTKAFTW